MAPGTGNLLAFGISDALAHDRAGRVAHVRYALDFTVGLDQRAPLRGLARIAFTLTDSSRPLAVDFAPDHGGAAAWTDATGRPVDVVQTGGHAILPSSALVEGDNLFECTFDLGTAPLHREPDFFYTLLVPARAHEVFPCFDQPDLKARFEVHADVPSGWEVVSNGSLRERVRAGDRERFAFHPTRPISTYLLAVAAGRLAVATATVGHRHFQIFHRERPDPSLARRIEDVVAQHAAALDWLEQYTGIPYPFSSPFTILLVPAFPFSGMEHPGAVYYHSPSLLLDEAATDAQIRSRAMLIAHETAHMWFGNLVTMRWFSDVWVKEVFAGFMAAKLVNASSRSVDHDLEFFLTHYPPAYAVDRTTGTHPIRQPLANLRDASLLYGPIVYDKSPIVMRALESRLGEGAFQRAVREYLRRFADGNASWDELLAVFEETSGQDLACWSRAWIDSAGRPVVHTELQVERETVVRLELVHEPPMCDDEVPPQSVDVVIGHDRKETTLPVAVAAIRTEVVAARGRPAPDYILPGGRGIGYGRFALDPASRSYLARHLDAVVNPLTKAAGWVTLWDEMLQQRVSVVELLALGTRVVAGDTNALLSQRVLSDLVQLFWRFLPPARRAVEAATLERMLLDKLGAPLSRGAWAMYAASLRDVAFTGSTIDQLAAVWRRDATLAGVPLTEAEEVALAESLALRARPGCEGIIDAQCQRTGHPSRRQRLAFVAPALSLDADERDAFFGRLHLPEHRRPEPWVIDAVRLLHHPSRGAQSLEYVGPSLEWLPDIRKTGDIFFARRWVDATLAGYGSPDAAAIVRRWLATSTADPALRRLVLVASHDLFVAAATRAG